MWPTVSSDSFFDSPGGAGAPTTDMVFTTANWFTEQTVTVDVSGELIKDSEAEIRQIMARQ